MRKKLMNSKESPAANERFHNRYSHAEIEQRINFKKNRIIVPYFVKC
jgi:hypothetical protein